MVNTNSAGQPAWRRVITALGGIGLRRLREKASPVRGL